MIDHADHRANLLKGFEILAVAVSIVICRMILPTYYTLEIQATFIAAIQAQVMSTHHWYITQR